MLTIRTSFLREMFILPNDQGEPRAASLATVFCGLVAQRAPVCGHLFAALRGQPLTQIAG
jgi:hypothetical protein